MADTGEDREIKDRVEANETERFRESRELAVKTREGNQRHARKPKRAVDPKLYPPRSIRRPAKRS